MEAASLHDTPYVLTSNPLCTQASHFPESGRDVTMLEHLSVPPLGLEDSCGQGLSRSHPQGQQEAG